MSLSGEHTSTLGPALLPRGQRRKEAEARDCGFSPVVIHLRVPRLWVRVLVVDIETGPRILGET